VREITQCENAAHGSAHLPIAPAFADESANLGGAHTCPQFKVDLLLIEGIASGIPAAQELANRYPDEKWSIHLVNPKGDKQARALAPQPTFSQGLVFAPTPPAGIDGNSMLFEDWAEAVIEEMAVFPKGRYGDLTDSTCQALSYLRSVGLGTFDETVAAAEREAARRVSRFQQRAIYPV